MNAHVITVLAGDGIGLEVMPVAMEVLEAAQRSAASGQVVALP